MNEVDFYLEDLKSRFIALDKKYGLENYVLAYSGGKDSHLLYWFIKQYLKETKIQIIGINTYMEHNEIRERIYKYSDKVLLPKLKPFVIKSLYGSPCFSKIQDEFISRYQNGSRTKNTMKVINGDNVVFNINNQARYFLFNNQLHRISNKCCNYLKKQPMNDYLKHHNKKSIIGITKGESKLRDSKYKTCLTNNGDFVPIYDLDEILKNKIIKKYNIEAPKIYQYLSRTGCMGCPYGKNTELELSLLNKNQREFIIKYHKESYDILGIDYKNEQMKLFE